MSKEIEQAATDHANNVPFDHTYMGDCYYSFAKLKEAYEAGAKAQQKELDSVRTRLRMRVSHLESKLDAFVRGIQFYADPVNWFSSGGGHCTMIGKTDHRGPDSGAIVYGGKLATELLERYETAEGR